MFISISACAVRSLVGHSERCQPDGPNAKCCVTAFQGGGGLLTASLYEASLRWNVVMFYLKGAGMRPERWLAHGLAHGCGAAGELTLVRFHRRSAAMLGSVSQLPGFLQRGRRPSHTRSRLACSSRVWSYSFLSQAQTRRPWGRARSAINKLFERGFYLVKVLSQQTR